MREAREMEEQSTRVEEARTRVAEAVDNMKAYAAAGKLLEAFGARNALYLACAELDRLVGA